MESDDELEVPVCTVGPRRSNLRRAKLRQDCRLELSEHLKDELGIQVKPEEVRLIPEAEDGYRWDPPPEMEYLFTKQLSKHSIGAYVQLYHGVKDKKVKARLLTDGDVHPRRDKVMKTMKASLPNLSNAETTIDLEQRNASLLAELEQVKKQAHEDQMARKQIEEELTTSRKALRTIQQQASKLHRQHTALALYIRKQKKKNLRCESEINVALSSIQRLRSYMDADEENQRGEYRTKIDEIDIESL